MSKSLLHDTLQWPCAFYIAKNNNESDIKMESMKEKLIVLLMNNERRVDHSS